MGVEIERKFLLEGDAWRAQVSQSQRMRQGYLVDADALAAGLARSSVRVRVAGDQAWLNIKSAELGIARTEYEYPVPVADAEHMLEHLCRGRVSKTRHLVPIDGFTFEIDQFEDDNAGLLVAEIELPTKDSDFPRPAWLGREVSHLARYYNVQLIAHPWRDWSAAERRGEGD